MSLDPHAAWGDRTPLYDEAGELIFMFTLSEGRRIGRPWADGVWRPDGIPTERAVDTALSTFAGHAFSTSDRELAGALMAAGATEHRHAQSMSHSLTPLPTVEVDPAVELRALPATDISAWAQALGRISIAAYPPGHPDHEFGDAANAADEIRQMGRGEILGPYLDVSQLALLDGRPLGACIVVDRPGKAPDGGPWIVDVFRDPDSDVRGIGSAVIAAALAAAKEAGLPSVSLVVSHTNANAMRLYRHLGFLDAAESWTLALP